MAKSKHYSARQDKSNEQEFDSKIKAEKSARDNAIAEAESAYKNSGGNTSEVVYISYGIKVDSKGNSKTNPYRAFTATCDKGLLGEKAFVRQEQGKC